MKIINKGWDAKSFLTNASYRNNEKDANQNNENNENNENKKYFIIPSLRHTF